VPSEISELLEEAKAGAPPLRYDVDFVWLAGRRRRRRRNAGWAIAAVVAVAAAIGVPQILTRRPDRPEPLKLPAPVVVTTPKSGDPLPFVLRFHGYDAGAYRVAEPTGAGVDGSSTYVQRIDETNQSVVGAYLWIYEPGVDPLVRRAQATRIPAESIKGRPAFWLPPIDSLAGDSNRWLCWEYADGLMAILKPDGMGMPNADMRKVAEAFTLTAERKVVLPFKVGYIPPGWRLSDASGSPGSPGKADGFLRFEPDDFAAEEMKQPDRQLPDGYLDGKGAWNILVSFSAAGEHMPLLPSPEAGGSDPTKVDCDVEGCYHPVDNGRYRVRAGGSIKQAEIRKILASITEADPDDPATWFTAHDSVPPATLIRLP
jgi:hypothetical protein